jgi:hypothetical protein
MFRYNPQTYELEDLERSLTLKSNGGSSEISHHILSGPDWQLDVSVITDSNKYSFDGTTPILNEDYRVELCIRLWELKGRYNMAESPRELALEAITALEEKFFKTDLSRIYIRFADEQVPRQASGRKPDDGT